MIQERQSRGAHATPGEGALRAPTAGVEPDRHALACALGGRLQDIAAIQKARVGGVVDPQQFEEATATSRAFVSWLATGRLDVERIDDMSRRGATMVVGDAVSLRSALKLCLAWRDAVIQVVDEEVARLGIPRAVRDEAVEAARFGCDGFSVQLAAHYDRERAVLQEELDRSRARLEHRATHDPLTGLANRDALVDQLETALGRQGRPEVVVLLFVDLDRFKTVNDDFGHDAGDLVLTTVAERLESVVRPGDVVSRLGGDEFVILCGHVADADAEATAVTLAERLRAALAAPIELGSSTVSLSASVGIAVDRGAGGGPEDVVAAADAAMYVAKQRGRDCYEIHAT